MASDTEEEATTFEEELILKVAREDDFSVIEAVDQMMAHTAELIQNSSDDDDDHQASHHAFEITATLLSVAMGLHHSQHSRLVEFLDLLQRTITPCPNGGTLEAEGFDFWVDLPALSMTIGEFDVSDSSEDDNDDNAENNEEYENLMAFIAQISEKGIGYYSSVTCWSYMCLCEIFSNGNDTPTKVQVRAACLWLIYAPKKVWDDAFIGRTYRQEKFEPGIWVKWRSFLEHSQTLWLDEDTQELLWSALLQMDSQEELYQEEMSNALKDHGYELMDICMD